MKTRLLIILFSLITVNVMGQPDPHLNGTIKHNKTEKTVNSQSKSKAKKVSKRANSSSLDLHSKEESTFVEAEGYDVTFYCDIPDAMIYIDGISNGTINNSYFLKTGTHTIKVVENLYNDYNRTITVNHNNKSFNFIMTPKPIISKLMEDMVYVKEGTFMMGAPQEGKLSPTIMHYPVHQVTLSSFYICKYEVTQELWEIVMGKNPSVHRGDNLPVENVSWNDCQIFINKLKVATGKDFRLPTEAEWEFTARGGVNSCGYQYSGSNNLSDVAWYWNNGGNHTHKIGTRMPNELGIYDMSGNVSEWCNDLLYGYSNASQTNPTGATSGSQHIFRGGNYLCNNTNTERYLRSTYRSCLSADVRNSTIGFRLVYSK